MSGDRVVLDEVLKQHNASRAPNLAPDKFFEVFSVDQILKDNDLSYEDIQSGIFDGSNDAGIDWAYIFLNGNIVKTDEDIVIPEKGDLEIELLVGQSKNQESFKETPIDIMKSRLEVLLKFQVQKNELTGIKPDLADFFLAFRQLYLKAAGRFPKLAIRIYYASRGDVPAQGSKVHVVAESVCSMLRERFAKTPITFDLVGAGELLALARRVPLESFSLKLSESPVSSSREPGYIGLVKLSDFFSFISDENGNLRQRLFEANVRDYQGTKGSNVDIRQTLEIKSPADFWWLNNGVTIVASNANEAARILTIADPYIVNGLQTSNEIFRYFSEGGTKDDDRNVLVRVIVTKDSEIADKVIRATNSQIYIPPSQLKATEKIHRDIEDFMKKYDLYYDRRKNHYKMQGKPIERIVSILELAQAVLASALARPADARARPSSVLNNEADYENVFSEKYPLALYPKATSLLKICERFLATHSDNLSRKDRNNLRFYLMRRAFMRATAKVHAGVQDLADLEEKQLTADVMTKAYDDVRTVYQQLGESDQVAKGIDFEGLVNEMAV